MDSTISSLTDQFTRSDKKYITPENSPRKKDVSPLTPNTPDKGEIIIPRIAPPPPTYPPPQTTRPQPQIQALPQRQIQPQPPLGLRPNMDRPFYQNPSKGGSGYRRKTRKNQKGRGKKRKTNNRKRKKRKSIKNKKR